MQEDRLAQSLWAACYSTRGPWFYLFCRPALFGEQGRQPLWLIQCALIASYVFHSCQPLMGSGSAGEGQSEGLDPFTSWSTPRLERDFIPCSIWETCGSPWNEMCACSNPEVIHFIESHLLSLLEKDRQVEIVPLVLSLTQEALIASQVVQNLFMIWTSIKQQGRM